MSEQQPNIQQPSFLWLRSFAIAAGLHLIYLSQFKPTVPELFIWVDLAIILMWGLGSNGREAIIDILKARAMK